MNDLVVLVADLDCEKAIDGLLRRASALRIRSINYKIFRHPGRDPGVRVNADTFLRPFNKHFHRAMVILDWEGSGAEDRPANELELELESRLARVGWEGRSTAIAMEPELENWVWSASPLVAEILGWGGHVPPLREWLLAEGLINDHDSKPRRPKEALEAALLEVQKRPSASLFQKLAERVSLQTCTERTFVKFRTAIGTWFPEA
jgi:hypothetical protein